MDELIGALEAGGGGFSDDAFLSLSSFDDEQIALQAIDLIVELCNAGEASVSGEIVTRISSQLSVNALTWSRRQVYTVKEEEKGCSLEELQNMLSDLRQIAIRSAGTVVL